MVQEIGIATSAKQDEIISKIGTSTSGEESTVMAKLETLTNGADNMLYYPKLIESIPIFYRGQTYVYNNHLLSIHKNSNLKSMEIFSRSDLGILKQATISIQSSSHMLVDMKHKVSILIGAYLESMNLITSAKTSLTIAAHPIVTNASYKIVTVVNDGNILLTPTNTSVYDSWVLMSKNLGTRISFVTADSQLLNEFYTTNISEYTSGVFDEETNTIYMAYTKSISSIVIYAINYDPITKTVSLKDKCEYGNMGSNTQAASGKYKCGIYLMKDYLMVRNHLYDSIVIVDKKNIRMSILPSTTVHNTYYNYTNSLTNLIGGLTGDHKISKYNILFHLGGNRFMVIYNTLAQSLNSHNKPYYGYIAEVIDDKIKLLKILPVGGTIAYNRIESDAGSQLESGLALDVYYNFIPAIDGKISYNGLVYDVSDMIVED